MEAEIITARLLHESRRAGRRCRKSGGVLCWGVFAPRRPPAQGRPRQVPAAHQRVGLAQEPPPRVDDSMTTDTGHPTAFETLTAPVTVLVGHFGAGKSEIAVNLAFGWRERGRGRRRGRPRPGEALLPLAPAPRRDAGARHRRWSCPQDDRFYADLPIVVPEVARRRRPGHGGAAPRHRRRGRRRRRGAGAGLASPGLTIRRSTDVLFVVNGNRPFAETPDAVISDAARDRARVASCA